MSKIERRVTIAQTDIDEREAMRPQMKDHDSACMEVAQKFGVIDAEGLAMEIQLVCEHWLEMERKQFPYA